MSDMSKHDTTISRQEAAKGNGHQHGNGHDRERTPARTNGKEAQQTVRPAVDVIEDRDGMTLLADLPGVSKDRLNLHLDTDSLTIEGEMLVDLPEQMASRFAEVSVPRFKRTFTLSRDLDTEKASAELKNGVLRLRIPKAQHAQPRRIPINAP